MANSVSGKIIPGVLRLELPQRNPLPLLFDSPHSGTYYPEDFGGALDLPTLRKNEDTWVNELYGVATRHGATWLEALFSRNYIDLNRNATDIDPELVEIPYPGAQPSGNCLLGRGLLWRLMPTEEGEPIYNRRLSVTEIKARIENYHRPYHALLKQQLQQLHRECDQVWHINCHSMSSVSGLMSLDGRAGVRRPDFVLGDHDGTSCEPEFTRFVHQTLQDMGYQVTENKPYKGQELTSAYSRPALGFNSLQIEINKKLYMSEATREKNDGFYILRDNLERLIKQVAQYVSVRVAKNVCTSD